MSTQVANDTGRVAGTGENVERADDAVMAGV